MNDWKPKTKTDWVYLIGCALMVLLVVAFLLIIPFISSPQPEPGITFTYTEQRENEIFKSTTQYFAGTPLTFKFSSLDIDSIYSLYRVDWSSYDAETFSELVIRFTNRTEQIIIFAIDEDGFLFFRDNVCVIVIHCIPTMVGG